MQSATLSSFPWKAPGRRLSRLIRAALSPVPGASTGTIVEIFPAMFHPVGNNSTGEKITSAEEAACFYHPQKRASVPCDSCGRFLCALCDVELNGQHICPNCLQSGKKKGRLKNLENERVLHDHIALMLSVCHCSSGPLPRCLAPRPLYTFPSLLLEIAIRSVVPRLSKTAFCLRDFPFPTLLVLGMDHWTLLIAYQIKGG